MTDLPKAAQGTFNELLADVEPKLAAIARRLHQLCFYEGALLADPEKVSEGTGKGKVV